MEKHAEEDFEKSRVELLVMSPLDKVDNATALDTSNGTDALEAEEQAASYLSVPSMHCFHVPGNRAKNAREGDLNSGVTLDEISKIIYSIKEKSML